MATSLFKTLHMSLLRKLEKENFLKESFFWAQTKCSESVYCFPNAISSGIFKLVTILRILSARSTNGVFWPYLKKTTVSSGKQSSMIILKSEKQQYPPFLTEPFPVVQCTVQSHTFDSVKELEVVEYSRLLSFYIIIVWLVIGSKRTPVCSHQPWQKLQPL